MSPRAQFPLPPLSLSRQFHHHIPYSGLQVPAAPGSPITVIKWIWQFQAHILILVTALQVQRLIFSHSLAISQVLNPEPTTVASVLVSLGIVGDEGPSHPNPMSGNG